LSTNGLPQRELPNQAHLLLRIFFAAPLPEGLSLVPENDFFTSAFFYKSFLPERSLREFVLRQFF
jgi:hypothetical protein